MISFLKNIYGTIKSKELPAPAPAITHHFLIILAIYFLLQDLLANNFMNNAFLFNFIKYIDEIIPIFIFLLLVLTRLSHGRSLTRHPIDIPLLLFLAVSVLSSLAANVPYFIILPQFILYIKAFLLFFLFFNLPLSPWIFRQYVQVFFVTGMIFLFFGGIDLLIPAQFRNIIGNTAYIDYRNGIPSVQSFFTHPGVFGWFMSFLALYAFAFSVFFRKKRFFIFGLLFFLGCFFAMRARSIFGIFISLLFGLFFVPKKMRKKIILFLIPLAIIGFILIGGSLTELLQSKYDVYIAFENPMEVARNVLYFKCVDVAADHFPLGAGMGRYGSWLSLQYYSPIYYKYGLSNVWGISKSSPNFITDTFWPMIIGESGFIGFALYILIFILFLSVLAKRIKTTNSTLLKAFQVGTFMILIEGLIESIGSPIFSSPPGAFFILGAVGIASRTHPEFERIENSLNIMLADE
ncbi:MAG: hypothetical protein JW904_02685 [Spirochaetales bacterium]|nr:hypothetical protein [Spirochaetales bacterium]